ncbi:MAG: glycosyl hydrolase family 2 [Muribaculaceae bacterium]|nr:glycosyl hydrolase family 2 [Muribaculaceae bacterium]
MKRTFFILFVAMAALCATAQSWPPVNVTMRPGARWWWMGSAVDTAGINRQMRQCHDMGIGTLEITPIYGVQGNEAHDIAFLSPRWMQMLRHVEEQGLRLGLQIDMNCGTGWPFGGPTVSVSDAAKKMLWRTVSTPRDCQVGGDTTLLRVMAFKGKKAQDITALWSRPGIQIKVDPSWTRIALMMAPTRQEVNRAAPGGEGWVIDHFDRGAVARYLERFETAFAHSGVPYPHTFFNDSYEVEEADWTPTLLTEFEQRRGYKLENHLPEFLGLKPDKDCRVMVDYRKTLGELLLENFTRQWADWAHDRHVAVRNQAHGSPANLIDVYAAVDVPEIEGFGLSDLHIKGLRRDDGFTRPNKSDFSMLKYASSAAHITGKPLTSSECFTWLTEHFRTSLSQLKPDMDLMFCAGVNRMFFHGLCYSPQDAPWPGWKFYATMDMSPTNSIWRDARGFMDYVTRCQSFLQMGMPDNDVLVYLPITNMWASDHEPRLMMMEIGEMNRKCPEFVKTVLALDSLGYDCDYISDRYLLTTVCRDGQVVTEAGAAYRAIVVPTSPSRMPAEVRRHLNALRHEGVTVIEGVNEQELAQAARPEALKKHARLKMIRRSNDAGHHYFMANLTPSDVEGDWPLAHSCAQAVWFNPLNGERYAAELSDGKLHVQLKSGESMILQTYDQPLTDAEPLPARATRFIPWLTLDHAWSLRFLQSEPPVTGTFALDTLQSWTALNDAAAETMGTGIYTCSFALDGDDIAQSTSWFIDLGDVRESARVRINGMEVGCAWSVPFRLTFNSSLLREGMNEVEIEVTNLPANRIAAMDRRGEPWRKFKNINMVDIHYEHTTYGHWQSVPSGLLSPVTIGFLH